MNIFYLSNNVEECAKMHCDKHVIKMILEYCQLLSTAHRMLDGVETTGRSPSGRLCAVGNYQMNVKVNYTKQHTAIIHHACGFVSHMPIMCGYGNF